MSKRAAMKTAFLILLVSTFGSLGWSTRAESQVLPARLFTTTGHHEIRFASGSSAWCVNVEPINNNFQVTDLAPCSIVLISPGTGSVSQISLDFVRWVDPRDIEFLKKFLASTLAEKRRRASRRKQVAASR